MNGLHDCLTYMYMLMLGRITGFTVSSGAGTWMRGASADTCKHGHGRTKVLSKKDQTIDNSREKKKAEHIKILQVASLTDSLIICK